MTIFQAYFGGLSSFFSVWVFCLMQVIPFFLAFAVGLLIFENKEDKAYKARFLAITLLPLLGFLVLFVATGMSTTSISRKIFLYNDLLNRFGGVIIGLSGFYLLGLLSPKDLPERVKSIAFPIVLLLFGASLAVAYKPCVTPTLTAIFAFSGSEETANFGAIMLIFYTLGISTAIFASEFILAFYGSKLGSDSKKHLIKNICGVVVLFVSILILSGQMTNYKSFLVGRFVPDDSNHHHHQHNMMDMKNE